MNSRKNHGTFSPFPRVMDKSDWHVNHFAGALARRRWGCYGWGMRLCYVIALLLPLATMAQEHSPLLVVGAAETEAKADASATPPSPTPPASPANPSSPTPPPSPVSKLWPRDTIPLFLPSCTGLRPQYVAPCTCVITKLMLVMGHDEFLKKSEDGTLEQDPRLQQIRLDCVTEVKRKE